MYSTYKIKTNELNQSFLDGIKKIYQNHEIEIVIYDVEDETEYLLKSEANKKRLIKAIKNVDKKKDLIEVDVSNL